MSRRAREEPRRSDRRVRESLAEPLPLPVRRGGSAAFVSSRDAGLRRDASVAEDQRPASTPRRRSGGGRAREGGEGWTRKGGHRLSRKAQGTCSGSGRGNARATVAVSVIAGLAPFIIGFLARCRKCGPEDLGVRDGGAKGREGRGRGSQRRDKDRGRRRRRAGSGGEAG